MPLIEIYCKSTRYIKMFFNNQPINHKVYDQHAGNVSDKTIG